MKSTLQFLIPILVVLAIGGFLMLRSNPPSRAKRLHIRCNNSFIHRRSFRVASGETINFSENHDSCNLEIRISSVEEYFMRIYIPYLYQINSVGEKENAPRRVTFVETKRDTILYTEDGETRFILQFR